MTDPEQAEAWMTERRLLCELEGHFTKRIVYEETWGEPYPNDRDSDADFCLCCDIGRVPRDAR